MQYRDLYNKFCDYLDIIAKDYKIKKINALASLIWCYVAHGASPTSWFMFKMYKLNERGRRRIITAKRNDELDHLLNDREYAHVYDNKAHFNKEFSDFVKRDWLYLPEASRKDIGDFLDRHNEIVVKPIGLSSGRGIELLSKEEFLKRHASNDFKGEWMIEQRVIVHPDLQKLNPNSCNTLRVYTLVDKRNEIHIPGIYLKVGGGDGICDNFHNKGIMYNVDINYGIVDRPGLDFALAEHILHPSTQFTMPGRKIPLFRELKECAVEAQRRNLKARFIAWDIAITSEGCEIIEGNYMPNCNLIQIFDQQGKYLKIKSMV